MTVSIVGCGDSAKNWHKVPCDLSIGVNDCAKFGRDPDYLIIVNSPVKFIAPRLKTIKATRPKKFFSHSDIWKGSFPSLHKLKLTTFFQRVRKGLIYSSKTSPFIAISMAYNEGATDIIIWGVDFINHKTWHTKNKYFDPEFRKYLDLFKGLKESGVNVWLGGEGSCFEGHLERWRWLTAEQFSGIPGVQDNLKAMREIADNKIIKELEKITNK